MVLSAVLVIGIILVVSFLLCRRRHKSTEGNTYLFHRVVHCISCYFQQYLQFFFCGLFLSSSCVLCTHCFCLRLVFYVPIVFVFVLCFMYPLFLSSSCVLCTHCCQCLWIVNYLSTFRFSLTFIYSYLYFDLLLIAPHLGIEMNTLQIASKKYRFPAQI